MMKTSGSKLAILALGMTAALGACFADAAQIIDHVPKNGLQLWLSAGKVEQANGMIALIKDLSGNANDARRDPPTAIPAANPALTKDAASGQPVLRFSGTNVAFGFKRIPDIRTAFWVVSKDPAAFGQRNEKFVLGDRESNDFHAGWTDDTIFNTDVNPGHLATFLADGKVWLNGMSIVASKTPFPQPLSVISIVSAGPVRANQLARDRNFSGRSWQGDIAEILLYNVELTETDRQMVEKYLIRKYAIASGGAAAVAPVGQPDRNTNNRADVVSPEEYRTNWPRFRGPDGGGVSWQGKAPLTCGPKSGNNIAWTRTVPARDSVRRSSGATVCFSPAETQTSGW